MIATKKQWLYIQKRFELWLSSMDPQMFMAIVIINNFFKFEYNQKIIRTRNCPQEILGIAT